MKIEKLKIDQLKAADYNPRKDLRPGDPEFEKLKRSIEKYGYVEPAIFNKRTGNIVGGHQRVKVLQHLGHNEVDCVVVDIDEKDEKALNIALNKISGDWDTAKLTDLLKELNLSGYDTSLTGFEVKELDELFAGTVYDIKEDNFDEEAELEAGKDKLFTQSGDIWYLGRHKLLCGDSTAETDVKKLFNGKQADLILTDPPYNVDYGAADADRAEYKGQERPADRPILNDKMDDESFFNFLLQFYKAAYAVAKGGGVVYVFHSTRESANFINAMKKAGFKVSQTLIWAKDRFTLGRSDYQWQFEPILYGWKQQEGKPRYFIHDRTLANLFEDKTDFSKMKKDELLKVLEDVFENFPSDVVRDNRPMRSVEHPTMKPITLCARLIRNSSREKEIVFDAFGGSGSTMMACEQMNRTAFTMELAENYCDVIVRRFARMFPEVEIFLERDGQKQPLKKTEFIVE